MLNLLHLEVCVVEILSERDNSVVREKDRAGGLDIRSYGICHFLSRWESNVCQWDGTEPDDDFR